MFKKFLELSESLDKLYHFSTESNLAEIKKHGWKLSPSDAVYGRGVYLTSDPNFRNLPYLEVKLKDHKALDINQNASFQSQISNLRLNDGDVSEALLQKGFKSIKIHRNDGTLWVNVLDPSIIQILR
jgi:hypothetical protein